MQGPKQAAAEGNYDRKPRNHDQKREKPDEFDEFVVASEDQDESNT